VKKFSRPSSAPSSTRSSHKSSSAAAEAAASTTTTYSLSSRSGSALPSSSSSYIHHGERPSQSSAAPSSRSIPSANIKAAATQRTKHNVTATQVVRRPKSATSRAAAVAEKAADVTTVAEALSPDEQVTDKAPSSLRDSTASQEVGCIVIKQTAAADVSRDNEPQASSPAAADTLLTSGPSKAAAAAVSSTERDRDGGAGLQFAADAAPPRGASSRAAIFAADSTANSEICAPDTARKATVDDDEDRVIIKQHGSDDAGLMCRHDDVITDRRVTCDITGAVTMADKRQKSPDPFCDDDDAGFIADTVDIPGNIDNTHDDELSLQRQNSVLVQLLSAKKLELEESRARFRTCAAGLEDEVDRLRQEKDRLLDRLQLPEDERCSLSVEQQTLDELSRRLRQCQEQNDELKIENSELRQDLRDAELAMHELHDQFQAEEGVELRELQRELDNTARDCRLLHFKVGRLVFLLRAIVLDFDHALISCLSQPVVYYLKS